MYIHCEGFALSDVQQREGTVWQELTCFNKAGQPTIKVNLFGTGVKAASVGVIGEGTTWFADITAGVSKAGKFRVEHHPCVEGTSEVYDFILEGEKAYSAPVTVFVPKTGDMPDLVRQEQEAEALA